MISRERESLILENFIYGIDDDRLTELRLMFNTFNPEELHYLADNYNWDNGEDILSWIIDNPKCDKATALLIYWRADPEFMTQFESAEKAGWAGNLFNLLKEAEKKLLEGFYKTEKFYYDPVEDGRLKKESDLEDNQIRSDLVGKFFKKPIEKKWEIPEELKKPIHGQKVEVKDY